MNVTRPSGRESFKLKINTLTNALSYLNVTLLFELINTQFKSKSKTKIHTTWFSYKKIVGAPFRDADN